MDSGSPAIASEDTFSIQMERDNQTYKNNSARMKTYIHAQAQANIQTHNIVCTCSDTISDEQQT
jgi:hypothetical protein